MKRILFCAVLLAGTAGAVTLPKHQPKFDGMIVRCDDQGNCHWECEFGVVTSTVTIDDNLLVKPSGCAPKTPDTSGAFQMQRPLQGNTTEYRINW